MDFDGTLSKVLREQSGGIEAEENCVLKSLVQLYRELLGETRG